MRIRQQVLAEEPGCYLCRQWGRDDDEIDHVDGDVANNDRGNLRRAHKRCHAEKTGGR